MSRPSEATRTHSASRRSRRAFSRRCQISHSRFNEKAAQPELCRIIRHLGKGNHVGRAGDRGGPHRGACGGRHAAIHGAGADRRQGSGWPERHLRLRLRPPAAHGPPRLRRQERVQHHGVSPCDDPETDRGAGAAGAAGARAHRPALSRQGSRGSLADRARRRRRAAVGVPGWLTRGPARHCYGETPRARGHRVGGMRGRGAGGSLVRRRMGPPCSRAAFDHPVRGADAEGFSNPTTPEVSSQDKGCVRRRGQRGEAADLDSDARHSSSLARSPTRKPTLGRSGRPTSDPSRLSLAAS